MLILSRRIGQKLLIGNDIEILISKMGNGQVSLGISAPKQVRVLRAELLDNNCDGTAGSPTVKRAAKTAACNYKMIEAATGWLARLRQGK